MRSKFQVNYEMIEKDLIDPTKLTLDGLKKSKDVERKAILKAVSDRENVTYAIQVATDAPALAYQTHFWNFWSIVQELRETHGVSHRESGAVYE